MDAIPNPESTVSDPRYPTGPFARPSGPLAAAERAACIDRIASTPARLRAATGGLDDVRLDTPYRPGGWTVRQLVHHVPDSHMNAYVRFKLALTEDAPLIKTYDEAAWAELDDTRAVSPETSLRLLEALHERWVAVLRSMGDAEFARTLQHPEWGAIRLDFMLALYAWHGDHHVAHVVALAEREGWG